MAARGVWLYFAWLVSIAATVGSLYFSEVRAFVPCALCWWQRILMYPLVVVLGVATFRQDLLAWRTALPLSVIGLGTATYHYLLQKVPGLAPPASCASGVISFVKHEKRRFVEKLDYLTSVGWYRGGDSRRRLGLPRGGPIAVVTNLGVMKFDDPTKEMYLACRYPGVPVETILENTGFPVDVSRAVETEPPSAEELKILRDEVDPQRLILQ